MEGDRGKQFIKHLMCTYVIYIYSLFNLDSNTEKQVFKYTLYILGTRNSETLSSFPRAA